MSDFLKDQWNLDLECHAHHKVVVPLASLRREPVAYQGEETDVLQETQLLFGERVEVLYEEGSWSYVGAWQQPRYDVSMKRWKPYRGWVTSRSLAALGQRHKEQSIVASLWEPIYQTQKKAIHPNLYLPLGATVEVLGIEGPWACIMLPGGVRAWILSSALHKEMHSSAEKMCLVAKKLIGMPYSWGGLSPWKIGCHGIRTSVDCSGLVHLAWRSLGVIFPRNAVDQYRVLSSLEEGEVLAKGDLIFSSKEDDREKISHVMILEDKETLLESTDLFGCVCLSSLQARLGHPHAEVAYQKSGAGKYLFFGRH